jgi:enoyl-CoA hydratase/carnithine racemase
LIRSETRDRIARIEIARPEKKNALTGEMYRGLAEALDAAARDPQARVVLLHGSRDCFTAGNDLSDFLQRKPGGPTPALGLFRALPNMEKPVVAAVAGPAVGIGTTLLLHCDLIYAAADARFQMPFVPLGIVPEFGSTLLLPRLAGYQRAAKLLLLGQPFTAQEAFEAGIVTAVVSKDDLFQEAEKAATLLASLPPESIRLTKRLMKQGQGSELEARIAEETKLFTALLGEPAAKEAISAILEKRKPRF